eukprot:TRINITY_DN8378_c0_g1_i1.p1 TRINITY_DN8378_c0_g1~~TRINITY_DN8378_c0_g1_i1.p1  ORF type:complete len:536 (+),score=100.10 TRINITY_DN8378_c0_g1_i1:346-1953(+)
MGLPSQRMDKRTQTGRKLSALRKDSQVIGGGRRNSNALNLGAGVDLPRYVPLFNGAAGSMRKVVGLEDPLKKGSGSDSSSGSDMSDSEHEVFQSEEAFHSLSALVNDYMYGTSAAAGIESESQQKMAECTGLRNGSSAGAGAGSSGSDNSELRKIVKELDFPMTPMEKKLKLDVDELLKLAVEEATRRQLLCQVDSDDCESAKLRRELASRLRARGYNAGVCKSQWDHSRGFPGGVYEYIDVMGSTEHPLKKPTDRMIVDTDFRAQFVIARPSSEFASLLEVLPSIFVGPRVRLETAVALMASATKRSMAKSGMQLPPWRKIDYIRAKWLSPYERITNFFDKDASSATAMTPSTSSQSVQVSVQEGVSQDSEWAAWSPVVFSTADLAEQAAVPSKLASQSAADESHAKENCSTAYHEDGGPEGRVVKGMMFSRMKPEAVLEERNRAESDATNPTCIRSNQQWQLLPRQLRKTQSQAPGKGMSALAAALVKAGLSAMSKQQGNNGDLKSDILNSEKVPQSEPRHAPLTTVAGIMIM